MKHRLFAAFLSAVLILLGSASHAITVYDAATDFSATNNPTGAWSYGYRTTVAGDTFFHYTSHGHISGVDFWWFGIGLPDLGQVTSGDRPIMFHPGNTLALADYVSILRWTAPSNGSYIVDATFSEFDARGPNALAYVVINGGIDFQASILPGAVHDYDSVLSLMAGDVLDFVLGNNGTAFIGDRHFTRIDATISTIPVPAAVWLFGSGLLGLLGVSRRTTASKKTQV